MSTPNHKKIFCALDTTDLQGALELGLSLKETVGGLKVGLEFFSGHGPAGVRKINECGLPVFLDLKLHDIPNTVAGAVRALAPLSPAMITIHTAGGAAMMTAAAVAAEGYSEKPLLLGVTVMTSLGDEDLRDIGVAAKTVDQVKRLAALALKCGLGGVVCSSFEVASLRKEFGHDLTLVVPGIRPAGVSKGDQKRVMTPPQAIAQGADYLVIGRAITGAADPAKAAADIAASLSS